MRDAERNLHPTRTSKIITELTQVKNLTSEKSEGSDLGSIQLFTSTRESMTRSDRTSESLKAVPKHSPKSQILSVTEEPTLVTSHTPVRYEIRNSLPVPTSTNTCSLTKMKVNVRSSSVRSASKIISTRAACESTRRLSTI